MSIAPVVLLHGIAASCPQPEWEDAIVRTSSAFVKCVEVGNGVETSENTSMFVQIDMACRAIKNDPDFAGKQINIVGLSQGGSIARGVVQSCEGLDVHTLFTYGAAHAGLHAYLSYETDEEKHWWAPYKNRLYGNWYSLSAVQSINS
jgi:triacylglycerol esterase/lipase EstA (alpha/beta hydrolase family)